MTLKTLLDRHRIEYSTTFGRTVGENQVARSDLAALSVGRLKSSQFACHIKGRTSTRTQEVPSGCGFKIGHSSIARTIVYTEIMSQPSKGFSKD